MKIKEEQQILKEPWKNLELRLDSCSRLPWGDVHCKTCDFKLSKKPIKLSCLSNYCKESECMKNRRTIRHTTLLELNIRSPRLFNFVIGFKSIPIEKLTKKTRLACHRSAMLILKKIQKIYGKFYYLSVRDLNRKNNLVRLHYHVAILPIKDFRSFVKNLRLVTKKYKHSLYGGAVSLSGYKKTSSTLNYFAKRGAGFFGHNREGEQTFTFQDIMPLHQYFYTFYRTKTFNTNFRFRTRKRTELIFMLNTICEVCPNCHSQTSKNIYFKALEVEIIAVQTTKPPQPCGYEKIFPEIVTFK